ncbi:MAG: hypothetical protein K6U02_06970 [Firmicutes bacterium]|nr:hypothetical protein [Bacillota bacterium]
MTRHTLRRVLRAVLALVALALAAYEYSASGLNAQAGLFLFLGIFLGFQAMTGAG